MTDTNAPLVSHLYDIFGNAPWPKPFHILWAIVQVRGGTTVDDAAKAAGASRRKIEALARADNPYQEAYGADPAYIELQNEERAKLMLGQLLLGRCSEMAFEAMYKKYMGTQEFELRDLRESRTDTDYRLYNGAGRAIYRINIKFSGSPFRRAAEMVGLAPEDCFALATYKIYSALQKQNEEHLPYLFAIVQASGLSAAEVGNDVPERYTAVAGFVHQAPRFPGKRRIEDALVDHLVSSNASVFQSTLERIHGAPWYVLSARRAYTLLREKLFDRVFALRIPGFARQFKRAELDMHFSLSSDLTPLEKFLVIFREEGLTKVATLLEGGHI